jgi:predicted nucleic acid-binding protein
MIPAPFRVVLDACVLYPLKLRDILLGAAMSNFYQVYWSEMILDEAMRNLISDGRMSEAQASNLAAAMRRLFPEAQVTGYEDLIPSMRNDQKDRHVVAAAVKAGAQVIVTENVRDFRDLPSGIEAQTSDEFLSNLFDLHPSRMMEVLASLSERYKRPPLGVAQLLESLPLREFAALVSSKK